MLSALFQLRNETRTGGMMAGEREYWRNDIASNIDEDRDLDHRVATSVDGATLAALDRCVVVERWPGRAAFVRSLVVGALSQRGYI